MNEEKNSGTQLPHSAEYFGEYRDHWWNRDFLQLMGARLGLHQVKKILDVGCGIGHWGQVLAPFFSRDAQLIGIDRESTWIAKANERARAQGLADRYRYQEGDATLLPFQAESFELVTCQTLLIHLRDPRSALREMVRVLRPGGILLAAEPNNFANRSVATSLTEKLSLDEVMARLRFGLTVERGKQALGLGFNSVGDLVPGYLAEMDLQQIDVFISDKAVPFFPPYSSTEQKVNIQQMREWVARGFVGWDRDELLMYFLAGGGKKEQFDQDWKALDQDARDALQSIEEGTYHSAGGCLTYLISAKKPG